MLSKDMVLIRYLLTRIFLPQFVIAHKELFSIYTAGDSVVLVGIYARIMATFEVSQMFTAVITGVIRVSMNLLY